MRSRTPSQSPAPGLSPPPHAQGLCSFLRESSHCCGRSPGERTGEEEEATARDLPFLSLEDLS